MGRLLAQANDRKKSGGKAPSLWASYGTVNAPELANVEIPEDIAKLVKFGHRKRSRVKPSKDRKRVSQARHD